jgi:hypothetical protein
MSAITRDRGRFFRFPFQSCFVMAKIPRFAKPKETDSHQQPLVLVCNATLRADDAFQVAGSSSHDASSARRRQKAPLYRCLSSRITSFAKAFRPLQKRRSIIGPIPPNRPVFGVYEIGFGTAISLVYHKV